MTKRRELTIKQKFGMLTVIEKLPYAWLCKCDCGGTKVTTSGRLITGFVKSCGCINGGKPGHPMVKTRIYQCWLSMKARCDNKNEKAYKNYGGRGISYALRWKKFVNFYEDMKEGYADNLTIERVNVNWNYCKENCKWITKSIQGRNLQRHATVIYKGKTRKLFELAEEFGINYHALYGRIFAYKIPVEKALTRGKLKRRWKTKPL